MRPINNNKNKLTKNKLSKQTLNEIKPHAMLLKKCCYSQVTTVGASIIVLAEIYILNPSVLSWNLNNP